MTEFLYGYSLLHPPPSSGEDEKWESYIRLSSVPTLECYGVTSTLTVSLATKHYIIYCTYRAVCTLQLLSFYLLFF